MKIEIERSLLVRCRRCGQETILDEIMLPCCSDPDWIEYEDGQPICPQK